jgi:hypothetical protein
MLSLYINVIVCVTNLVVSAILCVTVTVTTGSPLAFAFCTAGQGAFGSNGMIATPDGCDDAWIVIVLSGVADRVIRFGTTKSGVGELAESVALLRRRFFE